MTGILSGFFGIGGGSSSSPDSASTGMPIINAIGSSRVAVTALGLTTAINYALSGYVDWALAAVFILGGVAGGMLGAFVAADLSARNGVLNTLFAALIFVAAGYMMYRGVGRITAA